MVWMHISESVCWMSVQYRWRYWNMIDFAVVKREFIQIEISKYTIIWLYQLRYVPQTVQDMGRMDIYEWQWSVMDRNITSSPFVYLSSYQNKHRPLRDRSDCHFLYSTSPNEWAAKSSLLTKVNPLMPSRCDELCSDTFDSPTYIKSAPLKL